MATEVDRLVVVFDANFQRMEEKLNKVIRSNYAAAKKVESAWSGGGASTALAGFTGLIEGATSALPGMGSALAGLAGPAAAAALAIGGVAAAFHGAMEAVDFADELSDTADRLHVSTDALQQYRYAIRAAGGETKGADEALENFSTNLGKAKEGLTKAQLPFVQLGFKPAQIVGFKNANEALRAVVKAMEGLSAAEKDALVAQFGLGGLKQLVEGGADQMDRLLNAATELGVVMDADLIKRSAALKTEFEQAYSIIDVQMKSALVDLAPVILKLVNLMARFASAAALVVDAFRELEKKTTRGLESQQAQLIGTVQKYSLKKMSGQQLAGSEQVALDDATRELALVNGVLADRREKSAAAEAEAEKTTKTLIGKTGKAAKAKKAKEPGKLTELDQPLTADEAWQEKALLDRAAELRAIIEKGEQAVKPFDIPDDLITPDALADAARALEKVQQETENALYSGIRGGLEAGFKDGLPGVLHYLQDALTRSILDSVAEGLTSAVLKNNSTGGLLTSLASALFGRRYAAGTASSRAGLALVGERGPELVNLPGGSRVIPNSALRNVGIGSRGGGAGSTIIFDNRGAVIWEQAARQLTAYADRAAAGAGSVAIQVSRRATPDDLARRGSRRLGR